MALSHVTEYDDTLTHQVRFSMQANRVTVSCVCRVVRNRFTQGSRPVNTPIASSASIEISRELYNDPSNHFSPFDPAKDRARW